MCKVNMKKIDLILYSVLLVVLILIGKFVKSFFPPLRLFTNPIALTGKTVIITGCTSGIGKATAFDIARRGARVIMACRNLNAAEQVKSEIFKETGNAHIIIHEIDLESFKSIREFSSKIYDTESRLDILINNAGCAGLGDKKTADGINATIQVNYFAPLLLTILLADLLKKSQPSRVVNFTSWAHIFAYFNEENLSKHRTICTIDLPDYANSQLYNIIGTKELARRFKRTGVTVNVVNPGHVHTDLFRHMRPIFKICHDAFNFMLLTPRQAAHSVLHVALCDDCKDITGHCFANGEIEEINRFAVNDQQLAHKLWKLSEEIIHLQPNEKAKLNNM